jgi:hypothetical protein
VFDLSRVDCIHMIFEVSEVLIYFYQCLNKNKHFLKTLAALKEDPENRSIMLAHITQYFRQFRSKKFNKSIYLIFGLIKKEKNIKFDLHQNY